MLLSIKELTIKVGIAQFWHLKNQVKFAEQH